jgi:polyferredoxin
MALLTTAQNRMRRFDVLQWPLIGPFLRWRYARFALQVPLFLIALLSIYDGVTGRQLAPTNTATVAVWVHYRGLVALAIAVAGNLFCAACPLMLTRGPTKFLKRFLPEFSFPRALRNKYLVLALTVVFLFSYEQFDLWASPWLTAWLIIGYFVAALLFDTIFPAGTFCKYICPLGNFNFALSSASPTQIAARDPDVCTSCEGKYCLNGRVETETTRAPITSHRSEHVLLQLEPISMSTRAALGTFPGCETDLFVPTIDSNRDCTLCLNCARACPYDNVALIVRNPLSEGALTKPKTDWAWFVTLLAWAGLLNAFAMIPPYYALAQWLSNGLGTTDEALLLGLIMTVGLTLGVGASWLGARTSGGSLRDWVGVLYPLGLAAWGGHYLFHFITGASTLLPNIFVALMRLGLPLSELNTPGVPRADAIFPFQVAVSYVALFASLYIAWKKASSQHKDARAIVMAMLPQVLLALVFNTITILIFAQPMQARGSLLP